MIELIIVIAILGILAAILVPTMLNIVGDSRKNVDTANARSVFSIAMSSHVSISVEKPVTATELKTTIEENLNSNELEKECTVFYEADTDGNVKSILGVTCGEGKAGNPTGTTTFTIEAPEETTAAPVEPSGD